MSQGGWEKEKRKRAGHESCLTSLGLRFVGRVESALFLDLQFAIQCTHDLIGVSIENCCQYFSKANRKIQGETLGAANTFNIQEKTLLTFLARKPGSSV